MKKLFILAIIIGTFCNFALAQTKGLTQATMNMQSETADKVKQLLMQNDSERNSGAKKTSKNYAVFTPTASNNLKAIADEMGKSAEEKAMFLQVFTETKKGFEAQVTNGMKNNIAAAMTFLMASAVTVYQQSAEPSDAATEKLFRGLNSMFDEIPEMANVSSKDKQFLYDLYISYGGLILASYQEAKESNDKKAIDSVRVIAGSALLDFFKINPNSIYFEGDSLRMKSESNATNQTQASQTISKSHNFSKLTTNFDDGWISTPTAEYVSVRKNGVEVRLIYDNKEWEDSKPNTTQYDDYYWFKAVTPYFNVGNLEKWSSIGYEMEKLVQADAVDKQTGKRCFVVLWFVGAGNNRGVKVVVAPNRAAYQKEFPQPQEINKMGFYNKFGVSQQDLVGTWTGGNGGIADYYFVGSGNYAYTNSLSTSDEFIFDANGNYQQTYNSANTQAGTTQFAKLQYRGKYSVSDWEINATNNYKGMTTKFATQIVAVRGGYLLLLTDIRNNVKYTLFKKR